MALGGYHVVDFKGTTATSSGVTIAGIYDLFEEAMGSGKPIVVQNLGATDITLASAIVINPYISGDDIAFVVKEVPSSSTVGEVTTVSVAFTVIVVTSANKVKFVTYTK